MDGPGRCQVTRRTVRGVLTQLVRRRRLESRWVVGIDGFPGAGKSSLASAVGADLGLPAFRLDDFLDDEDPIGRRYMDVLRWDLLRGAVRARHGRGLILEGVLLLDVAERLALSLDCLIYVKRLLRGGAWRDGVVYDPTDPRSPSLGLQIGAYHLERRPDLIAQVVYERVDRAATVRRASPPRSSQARHVPLRRARASPRW